MRPGALESAPCSEGSRSFRDSATYSSLQLEYIIGVETRTPEAERFPLNCVGRNSAAPSTTVMIDEKDLCAKYEVVRPLLDERQRRLIAHSAGADVAARIR